MIQTNTIEMGPIVLYTIAWIVYIIGVTLHIKIINLSKKTKEATTWKLDIANSLILLLLKPMTMLMRGVTYIVPNLYTYTGRWFCYTYRAAVHYSILYHIGHSLVVSILKYGIIVQWQKIRSFGEEKFKKVVFWLNIFHPIFALALYLLVRPDYLFVWTGATAANRCLGEGSDNVEDNKTSSSKVVNCRFSCICEIPEPVVQNWFYDALLIVRKCVCVLQTITIYLMGLNILEVLFYYQIFSFASR